MAEAAGNQESSEGEESPRAQATNQLFKKQGKDIAESTMFKLNLRKI